MTIEEAIKLLTSDLTSYCYSHEEEAFALVLHSAKCWQSIENMSKGDILLRNSMTGTWSLFAQATVHDGNTPEEALGVEK